MRMMKGGAGEDTGWPGAVEGLGTVRISAGLESDSGQAGLAHRGGSSGRPDDRLRSGFTENQLSVNHFAHMCTLQLHTDTCAVSIAHIPKHCKILVEAEYLLKDIYQSPQSKQDYLIDTFE